MLFVQHFSSIFQKTYKTEFKIFFVATVFILLRISHNTYGIATENM